jgi:adenylosuccinate synthase
MGVNETVTRNVAGFSLRVSAVAKMSVDGLAVTLRDIVERWVPQRLEALGLGKDELDKHELYAMILSDSANFIKQAEHLKELIAPLTILDKAALEGLISTIEPGQDLLFEGAQGLALDETLGAFPYVTRSITGLPSAMAVGAFELNVTEFEPLYVTRAYLTRHGAGPLPFEGELITDKPLHDTTNIENMWQGALRKAPLNMQQLKALIEADIARVQQSPAMLNKGATLKRAQLMLTCLDQLGPEVCVVTAAGALTKIASTDLPITLARELGREVTVSYCSYGPTAAHVKSWI